MVRETKTSEMHSTFFFKPGQTLKNTKASDRPLALICPKSTYQRFVDRATEKERLAARKEEEAKKLEAFKKETYEMKKNWDNTIQNVEERRKEELLSRKHRAEMENEKLVKELAEKNAAERAEIVNQARKLLLYRKPLCRRINSALLTSECIRELEAQLAFQKNLKEMEEKETKKIVESDAEKVKEEKKKELEERTRKQKAYETELKKQIEENRSNEILLRQREIEAEMEEQKNMTKELELIKQCETNEILRKKKVLQKLHEEAIHERKNYEREVKSAENLEDRAIEIYQKAKDRIRKMYKQVEENEKAERERRGAVIAGEQSDAIRSREIDEERILQNAIKEREAADLEKREARENYEKSLRAAIEDYQREYTESKARKEQEEKEVKTWELMQRFKRDEFNKQVELEDRKQESEKKMQYAKDLQKCLEEKVVERQREKLHEEEDEKVKIAMEKANQRVLEYAKEVLEESKGVRPLFPILKAVQECEKELGVAPVKKVEEKTTVEVKPRRKRGLRRVSSKQIPKKEVFTF